MVSNLLLRCIKYKIRFLLLVCQIGICLAVNACSSKQEDDTLDYQVKVEHKLNFKVEGISGNNLENVSNYLNSIPPIESKRARIFLRDIRENIQKALRAYGYYHPQIEFTLPDKEHNPYTLIIKIDAGKPLFIRNSDIQIIGEGEQIRSLNNLVKNSKLNTYQILDHSQYENLKSQLISRAYALGFFDAKIIISRILVYEEQNVADISIIFDTGHRYKFGELIASDETLELLYPAKSLFNLEEGGNFSSNKINRLNASLTQTNYYRYIDITTDPSEAKDYKVPVHLDLKRKSHNLMRVGAGFSTDEGPRIIFDWEKPLLNKYGHSLTLNSTLSAVQQDAQLIYKIPRKNPNLDYYYLKLAQEHTDLNDTESDLSHFSIHYVANQTGSWRRDYSLRTEYEDYLQGDEKGNSFNVMPGFTLSRIETSRGFDPLSGMSINLDVSGGIKAFSDLNFARVVGRFKFILSPTLRTRVIGRFEQGAILGGDSHKVPPSLRFFVGGDQSIRGYGYQDESERVNGKLKGARYMTTASLEYQFPIGIANSRLAVFADAGIATDDYSTNSDYLLGPGFGYRYISRYGIFKVDLGFGVDKDPTKIRLHFAFGPDL